MKNQIMLTPHGQVEAVRPDRVLASPAYTRQNIKNDELLSGICLLWPTDWLNVVVHREFVGMWTLTEGIDLLFGLVPDPGIDHVLGEHVTSQQILMVFS